MKLNWYLIIPVLVIAWFFLSLQVVMQAGLSLSSALPGDLFVSFVVAVVLSVSVWAVRYFRGRGVPKPGAPHLRSAHLKSA